MSWPNPSMTRWLCHSRRTTTGDLRRINVQAVVKCGLSYRGLGFSWVWRNSEGEQTASISARVEGDENEVCLHLDYSLNGSPMKQRIKLEAVPCRFGGVRWLASCPSTGRNAAHLYIGSSGAYSRQAHGLRFDSQRECPLSRLAPARQGASEVEERRPLFPAPAEGNAHQGIRAAHAATLRGRKAHGRFGAGAVWSSISEPVAVRNRA